MKEFMEKAQQVADKAIKAAGETIDKVKSYAGEKTEGLKLDWELAKKKNEFDKMLLEYGKMHYYANATPEEIGNQYAEMVEAEAGIARMEAEINEIKAAKEDETEATTVYCSCCGAEYTKDDKFCSKCGNKLKK